MPIDIATETLIPLKGYCRMRPAGRNGRPMHPSTAYRHVFQGVRGVRLEHVNWGGNIYTSVEAVHRFLDRLNGAPAAARRPVPARVDAALDAEGF
jgi:hypothetical protein